MNITYTKQGDYLIPDLKLKEKDQMKWVQMMNNIANSTQEMVLNKIIYSYRTN